MTAMKEKKGRVVLDMQHMHTVINLPFDRSSSSQGESLVAKEVPRVTFEPIDQAEKDENADDRETTQLSERGFDADDEECGEKHHAGGTGTPRAIHRSDPGRVSLRSSVISDEWKLKNNIGGTSLRF